MAAAVYVDVQPAVLDWVIQRTQFENVSSDITDKLTKWRDGIKKPTVRQLEDVSRKTHIPFGYFFLHTPPKEDFDLVEYRTVDSEALLHPSRNLIDIVSAMAQAQEWFADYCKESGFDPLPFVGRFSNAKGHSGIAEDIRRELYLAMNWFEFSRNSSDSFRYLAKRIEECGVMVTRSGVVSGARTLKVSEFRAFTLINAYAPLIFINSNDTDNAKLFSLLHELAHVWIGRDSLYNEPHASYDDVSRAEQICNAVAAEILVPDELFKAKWQSIGNNGEQKLETLRKYFKCSRFVIVRKALENGFISRGQFTSLNAMLKGQYQKQLKEKKEKKGGRGNYYSNLIARWSPHFILALAQSTENGRTSYTEAYRLTGTRGSTFDKLAQKVGNGQ